MKLQKPKNPKPQTLRNGCAGPKQPRWCQPAGSPAKPRRKRRPVETMRLWRSGRPGGAAARPGQARGDRGGQVRGCARVRASSRGSPAAGAPRRVFRRAPRAAPRSPTDTRARASPARLQSERRPAALSDAAAGRRGGRGGGGGGGAPALAVGHLGVRASRRPGPPRAVRGARGSVPGKPRRWSRAAPAARGVEKENRKRGGRTAGRG